MELLRLDWPLIELGTLRRLKVVQPEAPVVRVLQHGVAPGAMVGEQIVFEGFSLVNNAIKLKLYK